MGFSTFILKWVRLKGLKDHLPECHGQNPMDTGAWQATYSPWGRKVRHDLASKLPPECHPPYPHFHPTLGFLLLGLWFSSKRHLRLLNQGEVAVCLGHSDLRVGVLVCECYHHCPLDRNVREDTVLLETLLQVSPGTRKPESRTHSEHRWADALEHSRSRF